MYLKGLQDWSLEDQKELQDLILEYASIFAMHDMGLGNMSLVMDDMSFNEHYRHIPPCVHKEVHDHPSTSCRPAVPQASQAPQGQQLVHLNWSNFKPEFSGKPDEDTEAHLLHTNDWMNAHHFIDGIRVQRFCLTLLGEARV